MALLIKVIRREQVVTGRKLRRLQRERERERERERGEEVMVEGRCMIGWKKCKERVLRNILAKEEVDEEEMGKMTGKEK